MNEQESGQPKTIRITEADLSAANEADLSQINTTHAFDRPEFIEFFETEAPVFLDRIQEAVRPGQSSHADELEKWEGAWILKRKDIKGSEDKLQYLIRLLYEEFFSVNQNPGKNPPEFNGSYGMTPGGLISHFYSPIQIDNQSVKSVVELPFQGKTLREAIDSLTTSDDLEGRKQRSSFVGLVYENTYENDSFNTLGRMRMRDSMDKAFRDEEFVYLKEMDSLGYRLLAMLKAEPEMIEPVADQKLLERFGVKRAISRAEFIVKIWGLFSRDVFTKNSTYRHMDEGEAKEVISYLLTVRTHPELQIFFKYLSPSGYVNDWLNSDNTKVEKMM